MNGATLLVAAVVVLVLALACYGIYRTLSTKGGCASCGGACHRISDDSCHCKDRKG